jgi:hypothetical protein
MEIYNLLSVSKEDIPEQGNPCHEMHTKWITSAFQILCQYEASHNHSFSTATPLQA